MKLSRRSLVKNLTRYASSLFLGPLPWAFAQTPLFGTKPRGRHVLILGGGVGGLSAAHELLERGFDVTLIEKKSVIGGKARSFSVPGSGREGRPDLPAEHGFRYFPGFCRHLPELMSRIPTTHGSVAEALVPTTQTGFARAGIPLAVTPNLTPTPVGDLDVFVKNILTQEFGLSTSEAARFVESLSRFLISCPERRLRDYANISWWDFVGASHESSRYQNYVGRGLTTSLQSGRPKTSSAKTFAQYLTQLIFVFSGVTPTPNRVLNGPTQDVWFLPWLAHLKSMGLNYIPDGEVTAVNFDGQRVASVTCAVGGRSGTLAADFYIGSLPVEVMRNLVTGPMVSADPSLASLRNIQVDWMNGVQFYLSSEPPLVRGHFSLLDSPWSITGLSQTQFWKNDAGHYGSGRVKAILSVVISDWNSPGRFHGKPAKECSRSEILEEVWSELKLEFNEPKMLLRDEDLIHSFLDPAITWAQTKAIENREPIFITSPGSWQYRPEAVTRIPNFFLAADYVRTETDVASMESANEAARRAVNGILSVSGAGGRTCSLFPLYEPPVFRALQELDKVRFALGLEPQKIQWPKI